MYYNRIFLLSLCLRTCFAYLSFTILFENRSFGWRKRLEQTQTKLMTLQFEKIFLIKFLFDILEMNIKLLLGAPA